MHLLLGSMLICRLIDRLIDWLIVFSIDQLIKWWINELLWNWFVAVSEWLIDIVYVVCFVLPCFFSGMTSITWIKVTISLWITINSSGYPVSCIPSMNAACITSSSSILGSAPLRKLARTPLLTTAWPWEFSWKIPLEVCSKGRCGRGTRPSSRTSLTQMPRSTGRNRLPTFMEKLASMDFGLTWWQIFHVSCIYSTQQ